MNKKQSPKAVPLRDKTQQRLAMEKAKDGRTLIQIVDDAINMYIDYKDSERLLNRRERG